MSDCAKKSKSGRPKKGTSPFTSIFCDLITGLNQQEAAGKIGVARQNIGRWLSGETTPDIDTLGKIATAFDVSTDYLLGRTNSKSTDAGIQAISKCTGISDKAAENLRKNAGGYWKPLSSVLENERFWQLLNTMETYSAVCRDDENLGKTINEMVFSTAKMLLPDPQLHDLIEINDAFFQSVFSQYIMQIANDYSMECFGKDGDTNGKHKQEDE